MIKIITPYSLCSGILLFAGFYCIQDTFGQTPITQLMANDLVSPVAYDQFGRETTKYLPYANPGTTVSDGSYRSDALNAGAGQSLFYTAPPLGVITTPAP